MVFIFHNGEFLTDLRHETTHAILHTLLPMVPLWLDEGLAEYFEVERNRRIKGNPHLAELKKSLRWRRVPRLAPLEELGDLEDMSEHEYRDAWAWTHFMLHGPQGLGEEFRAYLADIQRQTPPGTLDARLHSRHPNMVGDFRKQFKQLA